MGYSFLASFVRSLVRSFVHSIVCCCITFNSTSTVERFAYFFFLLRCTFFPSLISGSIYIFCAISSIVPAWTVYSFVVGSLVYSLNCLHNFFINIWSCICYLLLVRTFRTLSIVNKKKIVRAHGTQPLISRWLHIWCSQWANDRWFRMINFLSPA